MVGLALRTATNPDSPPPDWNALVSRLVRRNTVRCWASLSAFADLLTAVALQRHVATVTHPQKGKSTTLSDARSEFI